ncbi:MAG TPA: cytochrome P450 [Myxococcota bacterium]|nr:cytochrome P450 [Myxococcota bacterium]
MIEYDPFSEVVMRDPHPIYARLREEAPCYHLEKWDAFALSRFEDIWQASMDAESYTATLGTTSSQLLTRVQPPSPMINLMDPPQHTQLRSRIARFFTPGTVRRLEPQIRRFVEDAFAPFLDRSDGDLFNDFAAKVSVKVACLANGFPMEDAEMLNRLVWRFFARQEGVEGMTPDGLAAMGEMFGYFAELIRARRKAGLADGSVIDALLAVEVGGRRFSDEEASSHLSMFIIGGSETFPKVFSSTVHRLWQHADQRARCAKDPALIPGAFDEALRYDMPTQFLMRTLRADVTLHGVTMRKGRPVMFLYPSANRDPREFERPDAFDIDRRPPRILSFGHGIHACIGRHFANLEGRLCLETLLRHAPDYEVEEGKLRRIRTEFVQGWESMPVRYRAVA